jgi:transposase
MMKNDNPEVKDIIYKLKTVHNLRLSRSSVYKILNSLGKFKRPKEVPVLSQANRLKRFNYSKEMLGKSHKNIIFSDESKIEVRRNKRKVFHFKGQKKYKKYSTKLSIMVYGCISMRGKVYFKILERNVDTDYYNEIMNEVIQACNIVYSNYTWQFQQDNATAHVSEDTLSFLDKAEVKVLKHPPQSPDLNPIELVWSNLKHRVEKLAPKNNKELQDFTKQAWDSIPDDTIRNYIRGLKKVMLEVKRADGNNIPSRRRIRKEVS